ncbi:toprim domain-containing protein [Thalassobius sp. I31.1]|uniref:toprim domain-containing protein n=1 Tax=Thalassobius sp. I31.1 TaxID=2109912 RepID=UPI000D1BC55E|nr:toprim domain-containing protein [Thalassobius sp. I31.1]
MGVKAVDLPGLGQAVAFPYRRNGERYADKFRTVDKNWRSTKDVTRGLYNADALGADPELPVVITEGEMDCLSVIQSGFDRCVSLPDGWTEKGNKTEALIEEAERLQNSPFVIVAGDNDRAGESLPKAVANLLKGQDVRYVTWPDGCKDANDVLMTYGEGEVASCLNKATRIDPPGGTISGFSDLPPMSHRRVLRTGNKSADQRFAFEVGTMSVGTGIPGHGKSTLMTWLTHHVTRHENVRAGLIMFETHAHSIRDHLSLLSKGRAFDELSAPERKEAEADLDRRFRLVHLTFSDDTDHHLGWLESMVYTLAVREGCKFILIDPWNELEHLLEPGENMTNYVNFATRRIRQWAKALGRWLGDQIDGGGAASWQAAAMAFIGTMGLTGTNLVTPDGATGAGHIMTLNDAALIARHLSTDARYNTAPTGGISLRDLMATPTFAATGKTVEHSCPSVLNDWLPDGASLSCKGGFVTKADALGVYTRADGREFALVVADMPGPDTSNKRWADVAWIIEHCENV